MSTSKKKLLQVLKSMLKLRKKKLNQKPKVKPLKNFKLPKKLHQLHLKMITNNHGMLELLTMPLELLLKNKLLLNKLMKLKELVNSKRALTLLLQLLTNMLIQPLETEKMFQPTIGTNTGSLKLFHNQKEMLTVLTDN
jgi:hypothetical protein